jgi:hypothetical protein
MRRINFWVLVTAAFFCATGIATASHSVGPYFVQGGKLVVAPTGSIDLSGTKSFLISGTRWSHWGPADAVGRTTFYSNTCRPDCAAGWYATASARVRLSGVVSCRGRTVFNNFRVISLRGRWLATGDFNSLGYLRGC